ncbi:MAG: hypothetical protein M1834_003352 [Cirrosporium novae-zelandiae]|nr:MAG: hypothetical protein M1834_003352 [Cirrosporium novae-zelandiae]
MSSYCREALSEKRGLKFDDDHGPNVTTPLWNPVAGPSGSGFAPGPSYESIVSGTIGKAPRIDQEIIDSSEESSESTDSECADGHHSVARVISVLFFGVIIASLDATLIVATNAGIGSEFGRLQDSGWLMNAYTLSMCAVQPMYGKLSDIYGRKPCLLVAYAFFAIGCAVCAIGPEFWQIILGRAISGLGGAGMVSLVAVVITDIVPKRDVAAWRGYVNVCITIGTSVGGPVPLTFLAAIVVSFRLRLSEFKPEIDFEYDLNATPPASKLRRIDFLGTITLATAIVTALLILHLGGTKFPYYSWPTLLLGGLSILFLIAFVLIEAYIAKEPIFSLQIFRKSNVIASYIALAAQISAQIAMMFSVPLYFEVTKRTSATTAGAHLIPAIFGNATGSLLAGQWMRRTDRFKPFVVCAGLISSLAYVLLYLFWNGHTNFWESLYIFPGGFANGLIGVSSFIAMTSKLEPQDIATATTGLFFSQSIGMVSGISLGTAVLRGELKTQLTRKIQGEGAREIIHQAMADVQYVGHLNGKLRDIVVGCYIAGLKSTYIMSLACALFSFAVSLTLREHRTR